MLHFYEKPGCVTNRKQKEILRAAGFALVVRDLLSTPWEKTELRRYFGNKPVAEWFNPSAPAVKEKRVLPHECTADDALDAMLANPLLIRRPLLRRGDWYESGFDWSRLQLQLGIAAGLDIPAGIDACAQRGESV